MNARRCLKRRYPSEYAAQGALNRIIERNTRSRVPTRIHDCPYCGGWHLTSAPLTPTAYRPSPPGPSRPRLTGPTTDVRALVLARDEWACVRCGHSVLGAAYNLQHRIGRGSGGSTRAEINTPPNLVVMCGSPLIGCHGWATADPDAAAEWGWVLERNHRPALNPAEHPAWIYGHGWVLLDDHGGRHPTAAPNTAA